MSQEKKALAIAPRPPGITALPPRATQPKKTRASRPKVRSGCISCKIRRIKCDEGKPTCQRCKSAFILSILFITFEMIQGDMNTVDRLITNSINLLKNTLKLYRRDICLRRGTQLTQLPTEDDMEDMEHLLPHVSIMSGYTPFLHAQSSNIHLWDPSNGTDLPCFGQPTIRRLQIQWEKFSTRATAFIGRSMGFQMLPSKTRETIQEQRQVLITQLKVWEAELDSRLPKNEVPVQQPIHRRTLQMMQIQHRMLLICICSCLDITDLAYDAHEADFYMLVMDCAIYFHEWRPSYLFTLSTSILSALIVVVTRCRVHNIRMMAAGLLRQLTWREGAWDPALMLHGKLGGVLMEERERDESGFIAPEFRWFWAGADWDAERKFIVAKYTRAVPDERNEPVIKTLLLEPEVCPDVCSAIGCFEDHDLEREGLLPRYRC
ncbi:hypothetical protein GQ53DRAFT_717175 [Thozetella sp. PMI_491]|nr:hypothetical protein GQ53DRAFT_717175 [Thozetella sp. PMI_491]